MQQEEEKMEQDQLKDVAVLCYQHGFSGAGSYPSTHHSLLPRPHCQEAALPGPASGGGEEPGRLPGESEEGCRGGGRGQGAAGPQPQHCLVSHVCASHEVF